jgi:glycosyltransferase involved in cell wall biosynthesis
VPCYNYACYLRQAVTSVLRQACADVRGLILDGASPDETPDVARQLCLEDPQHWPGMGIRRLFFFCFPLMIS